MGTSCAPIVVDLFLICFESDFMLSLSDNNQADVIEALLYRFLIFATLLLLKSTSRYLYGLINIDNPYFEQMVGQI